MRQAAQGLVLVAPGVVGVTLPVRLRQLVGDDVIYGKGEGVVSLGELLMGF